MAGIALFPISLSNQEFSTANVLPALRAIFLSHTKVVFLVADHLQIYNKALRLTDGLRLTEVVSEFSKRQSYLDQRHRWISRVMAKIDVAENDEQWEITGIDSVADGRCFQIFRNVMLAYYGVPEFRVDVDRAADEHARQRNDRYPIEQREYLSRGYLLEEIALSLRVHIVDGIDDEYYLGQQSLPIINLYYGKYDFGPFDLAEIPANGRRIKLFYLHHEDDTARWTEYAMDSL